MAQLSDIKARNIKTGDKPLPHGSVTGLTLHPSTTKGHGKWVLRYVSPTTKKRRNAGLGTYPEISISEATKIGLDFREKIVHGIDPLEEKIKADSIKKEPLFSDAALILHNELLPSWRNKKHAQQWINTLSTYALPHIGNKKLADIEPSDIANVLRPIWLEKPETASRVKQRIHAVIAWGWANGYCQSNPVDVVTHLLPPQPSKVIRTEHQPAMDWRHIPQFISCHLHQNSKYEVAPKALEFLILTASRSGEVIGMTWDEIDLVNNIWTIPAQRMKAKILHRVPLSARAIEILGIRKEVSDVGLVFASPRTGKELSDMTLTSYLRKHKIQSTTANRIATAHGFRSSFRDWCSEHGYARDLAERALAHTVKNQVEAAYHRTDLLEKRRSLMDDWSQFILSELIIKAD